MTFTVVIPFFNGHKTVERLLDSIPESFPVLIVNDLSDEPIDIDRENVSILNLNKKGYFSGAVNIGIRSCKNDVLVLNQDTFFTGNGWIDLVEKKRDQYALIGEGVAGVHPVWTQGYIHGTFMFLRRDMLDQVGGLNELDYPLWGATCELQLRAIRAGFDALPVRPIPDFIHSRESGDRFGESIQTILEREPQNHDLLVRVPPLISVIIPTYNHGKYLHDAVNSLIGGQTSLGDHPGQTFQSFEVLIIDDCSTDDTWEICRGLSDSRKGIRAFKHSQNKGTPTANNTGIERAFGRYVTVLCGDDMMEKNRLEMLYRAIIKNPGRIVYDNIQRFAFGKLTEAQRMQSYDFDRLIYKNQIHCGILFERSAWEKVGGYPAIMNRGREDWAMNVRLGVNGFCGHHLEDYYGYLYRREGHNRTLTNTTPRHHEKFLEQIKTLHPEAYLPAEARPMACCSGRKRSTKPRPAAVVRRLPGSEDGMTLIKYTGMNFGNVTYYGDVTGTRYTFSASQPVRNVDSSDADYFLSLIKNRKALFQIYTQPVKKTAAVAPKPAIKVENKLIPLDEKPQEPISATEPDDPISRYTDFGNERETGSQEPTDPIAIPKKEEITVPDDLIAYDPGGFTVKEFKKLDLSVFSRDDIKYMITLERDNLDRKTIIKHLESCLV